MEDVGAVRARQEGRERTAGCARVAARGGAGRRGRSRALVVAGRPRGASRNEVAASAAAGLAKLRDGGRSAWPRWLGVIAANTTRPAPIGSRQHGGARPAGGARRRRWRGGTASSALPSGSGRAGTRHAPSNDGGSGTVMSRNPHRSGAFRADRQRAVLRPDPGAGTGSRGRAPWHGRARWPSVTISAMSPYSARMGKAGDRGDGRAVQGAARALWRTPGWSPARGRWR